MTVFRIAHPKFAHDLSGYGASLYGARWNERGYPVVYCAETSSLAILEFLVHIKGVGGNMAYKLLTIEMKNGDVQTLTNLPWGWADNVKLTQELGTSWLKSLNSVCLRVPSIHNPLENNILLNPHHPNFNPEIERADWYWYDGRLIREK